MKNFLPSQLHKKKNSILATYCHEFHLLSHIYTCKNTENCLSHSHHHLPLVGLSMIYCPPSGGDTDLFVGLVYPVATGVQYDIIRGHMALDDFPDSVCVRAKDSNFSLFTHLT